MTGSLPRKIRAGDAGITLIEMLVALVIFAFVGLASFTMLDTLLKVRAQTEGRLEVVAQIDRALAIFGHDFAQANPAGVTLANGELSLLAGSDQRHSYLIDDNTLLRIVAPTFGEDNTLSQLLVPDVQELRFAVLDGSNIWQETWPIEGGAPTPRAIRMTLAFDQGRDVSRMVELTGSVLP